MPVVGTAGHVDHGKSTLIEALTGRDPDRLAEEKTRGLTIDLGFAWTDLDGVEVSFVDVPGHERFMKNMLAGTEAVDVAMLVVAADEGWMPQTEEHLAVLDLLDIRLGVIAITKVDRVDAELLELAELEISEHVIGTAFESARLIPVSAVTGEGLDSLRHELHKLCETADAGRVMDEPTMWIDRSFSIEGAGTVVTGTLLGGPLSVGDTVSIWPGSHTVRVRTLHSHEQTHDTVAAGRRTAANLVGLDRESVGRGSLLTVQPWPTSTDFTVRLRPARYAESVGERGAYHLHMGSGSWPVHLRPLDTEDSTAVALIRSETPLPVRVGERFILRETGRQSVVAGGQVIDPAAPRRAATARESLDSLDGILDADRDTAATKLLAARGVSKLDDLARWTGGGRPQQGLLVGNVAVSSGASQQMQTTLVDAVTKYHADHPLREGAPIASLASRLGIDLDTTRALIEATAALRDDGPTVSLATFNAGLTDEQETQLATATASLKAAGHNVPRLAELGLDRELLHIALREERLIRVSDDLVYLPEQISAITIELGKLPSPFGVGAFKDAIAVSRKYAVPLLEFFDAAGITRRVGNDRVLR